MADTIWIKVSSVEIEDLTIKNSANDEFSAGINVIEKKWFDPGEYPCTISNIQIFNCDIESNDCGIKFSNVRNSNILSCNIFKNLGNSIYFCTANDIKIADCEIYDNGEVVEDNSFSGGIYLWWANQQSENIEISDCKIYDNIGAGIGIDNVKNVVINQNNIYKNNIGIVIGNNEISNVIIDTNTINNNGEGKGFDNGIFIHDSSNVLIENNILEENDRAGIYLFRSSTIEIKENSIKNNFYGIRLYSSLSNLITDNNIKDSSSTGIFMYGFESRNNRIYRNNLIDNFWNAKFSSDNVEEDDCIFLRNYWDNGEEGNYWSDFDEKEEGAFDKNHDGIVDSNYTISDNNTDNKPKIKPFGKTKEKNENFFFLKNSWIKNIIDIFIEIIKNFKIS